MATSTASADVLLRSFALSLGSRGTLLGSPLLLRILNFNPFIPYIPTIAALLPAQLQFRIMTVINEILDLVVGRFSFIDQFFLRTCVLIGSQYTQMLGLCLAPLLTLCALPALGSYRLITLPAEILKGALDGCFAGLLDAPLLFAGAVSYWSAMIPRILNTPLKILTAPLLFLKGYISSLFTQPPVNLLMICIYPLLTVIKAIPGAMEILAASVIALLSPLLVPLLCVLSPLLTPMGILLPYAAGIFRAVDQLVIQLLQLLNAIPALTQSFFILRMISKIIPLPFTTTIGCINTLYDLAHRLILLPLSLPGIEPAYQLFNLLIIPNGIINLCLSPVYLILFAAGSTITGAMKVLCIPELLQITMLVLMLPILTCSFILQTPSRLFSNLKMLTAMIIAIDPADESTGSLPETETTEALSEDIIQAPEEGSLWYQPLMDFGNWTWEGLAWIWESLVNYLSQAPEDLWNKMEEVSKPIEWKNQIPAELIRMYRKGDISARDLVLSAFSNNLAYTKGKEGFEKYLDIVSFTIEEITEEGEEYILEGVMKILTPGAEEIISIPINMVLNIDEYTGEGGAGELVIDLIKALLGAGAPPTSVVFLAWGAAPAVVKAITGHNITYHTREQPFAREYSELLRNRYFLQRHVNESFMRVDDPSVLSNDVLLERTLREAEAKGYAGIFVVEDKGESVWWPSLPLIGPPPPPGWNENKPGWRNETVITFIDQEGTRAVWSNEPSGTLWPYFDPYRKQNLIHKINSSEVKIEDKDVMGWTITGGVLQSTGDVYHMVDDPADNSYLTAVGELESKGILTREEAELAIDLYTGVEVSEEDMDRMARALGILKKGE